MVSSAETEVELEDNEFTYFSDHEVARRHFEKYLDDIRTATQIDKFLICLSDPKDNFRKAIYPDYKGNRKNTRKPLGFKKFRAWVEATWPDLIRCKPGLEADDVMGILATRSPGKFAIWTEDKDLATIPGDLWLRGDHTIINDVEADYFHMFQTLTGDTVDNYPGCPGIGEVKAKKILAEGIWWPAVVMTYEKMGFTEDDALTQARCARILRASDYDFNKKEPILWTPNS